MRTPQFVKEVFEMFLNHRIKDLKPEDKTDVFYISSEEGDFKITIERLYDQ